MFLRTVYYIAGSLKLCLQLMPPAALLAHGPHIAALTLITTVYASCGSNLDYIYVKIILNFLHDNVVFFILTEVPRSYELFVTNIFNYN